MDGLGGYPDGPEGRWQRYPDRGERGPGGFDPEAGAEREPGRGHDPRSYNPPLPPDGRDFEGRDAGRSYDGRPYGDRDAPRDRRPEPRDDDAFRVPEPRFGDPSGGRYAGPSGREDPLYGAPAERLDPGTRPRDDLYDTGTGGRYDAPPGEAAPFEAFAPRDFEAREEAGQRPVGPRSGVELPAQDEHHLTETIDRATLRRPPAPTQAPPPGPAPTVYRSRRPGLIILLSIGTAAVQLLLLFVLGHAMVSGHFAAGGMLAGIFGLAGVPLVALGLYALVTGAPAATGGHPAQSWFRAPTAYLPVGLVLLIAAALAAR